MNQMKTSIFTGLLCTLMFVFTSTTYGTKRKSLQPIDKSSIELNLSQFCNYLENGAPTALEGVYASPDGRYVIALVKNNAQQHDYIGIVCAADNAFWSKGDVKFNFVLSDSTELKGFYYNSRGAHVPVHFTVNKDSLEFDQLIKVDLETIKAGQLACFN